MTPDPTFVCHASPPRRAMVESDVYNTAFVKQCNKMDEVWVPTEFSKKVLEASGADVSSGVDRSCSGL